MKQTVISDRTLYIPSEFAKQSLIYLQEIGQSKTLEKHTNSRNKLDSYLFFIVIDGNGELNYKNSNYKLIKGSCVFIDCNNKYSHTSDNWTIKWVHFNGNNISAIYNKYLSRNGLNIFSSKQFNKYQSLLDEIQVIAKSNNYMRDMNINEKLTSLLSQIMSETVYEKKDNTKHIYDISSIKNYIDDNYLKDISLDNLSNKFFINKFYLTRLFKSTYGITINKYILNKKITKAKELLRFSDLNIEDISIECGINDPNYFSRVFKQIEGISPKKYKTKW